MGRQRRTIRLVQLLLVALGAGLLFFSGYSFAGKDGGDEDLDAGRSTPMSQVVVTAMLGIGGVAAALALQTEGGVRLLTPAKLREMEEAGELPIEVEEEVQA